MNRDFVMRLLHERMDQADLSEGRVFDMGTLAEVLINELAENWDQIPERTRAIMMGAAFDLVVQNLKLQEADIEAALVIEGLKRK
ncbi:MAG: hypothetical protein Q7K57_47580 [Burkholderiaceae bacterium]|nr:hypothetical protein [Burkholderiaceae bacterium]